MRTKNIDYPLGGIMLRCLLRCSSRLKRSLQFHGIREFHHLVLIVLQDRRRFVTLLIVLRQTNSNKKIVIMLTGFHQ
jgi:hypothetical protein